MKWFLILAAVAILAMQTCRDDRAEIRVASFNIEDFPKNKKQIAGAFDVMKQTGASIFALQEITEPYTFAVEMHERWSYDWELVSLDTSPYEHPVHHLAVAFDRRKWVLDGTASHGDTRLEEGRWKPVYEVRLWPKDGDRADMITLLVVHLKAGSDGREVRARQYAALQKVVRRNESKRIVLLGDFNATDEKLDRGDLAALARATGLTWASEGLACSAFWRREDDCPRSRLDHVLTWSKPRRIVAAGACATEGCDMSDRCPLYRDEVSDHCPVVVDL